MDISYKGVSRRGALKNAATLLIGATVIPSAMAQPKQRQQESPRAVLIPPGAGRKGKISRSDIVFKLDKAQTAGHFGSSEITIPPGQLGAPPHYHKTFEETCIVLEGTVHVMVEDEVFEVKKGGWHLRPRGKVHTFWNSGSTPATVIEICSPGGHEQYMQELARLFENGARPAEKDLQMLAGKYDIVFEFEKLDAIIKKYRVGL